MSACGLEIMAELLGTENGRNNAAVKRGKHRGLLATDRGQAQYVPYLRPIDPSVWIEPISRTSKFLFAKRPRRVAALLSEAAPGSAVYGFVIACVTLMSSTHDAVASYRIWG